MYGDKRSHIPIADEMYEHIIYFFVAWFACPDEHNCLRRCCLLGTVLIAAKWLVTIVAKWIVTVATKWLATKWLVTIVSKCTVKTGLKFTTNRKSLGEAVCILSCRYVRMRVLVLRAEMCTCVTDKLPTWCWWVMCGVAGRITQLMEQLDVYISVKPKPKQPSKVSPTLSAL